MARREGGKQTSSDLIRRLDAVGGSSCVFRGVLAAGDDEDHVRFSVGGAAPGTWQAVPTRMVQSVQPLAKVQAGDAVHHWVSLELRKPDSVADGHTFASIAQHLALASYASPMSAAVGSPCPPGQHLTFDPELGRYVCAPGAPAR